MAKSDVLNFGPLGAPSLEQAAILLDAPLPEVKAAARYVKPWVHVDGRTRIWSLRQLNRVMEMGDRGRGRLPVQAEEWEWDEPEAQVRLQRLDRVHIGRGRGNGKGKAPCLTREQAEAAVIRARQIGTQATADELGIAISTLTKTWTRMSLGTGPRYPKEHPRGWKLTREQAEAALTRAREVGRDVVAKELGVSQETLRRSWQRWDLGTVGCKTGARIREQRRRSRTVGVAA
jgi:hypothetical protein